MPRTLRGNLEPNSARWATRRTLWRALWRALDLTGADMEKPKIAGVNSSSELAICFSHLDAIATRVKTAIRAAGAIPFEIRTTAPSEVHPGDILVVRGLGPKGTRAWAPLAGRRARLRWGLGDGAASKRLTRIAPKEA